MFAFRRNRWTTAPDGTRVKETVIGWGWPLIVVVAAGLWVLFFSWLVRS